MLALLALVLCVNGQWMNVSDSPVQDWAINPILSPTEKGEWILGDPTVVQIGEKLHLFANEVFHGILHLEAPLDDPTAFTRVGYAVRDPGSMR